MQARNGANGYGDVFVDSKITSDAKVTGQVLARIDATVSPSSNVAFFNCQMSAGIAAKGWTITPAGAATDQRRFWEYQITDEKGGAPQYRRPGSSVETGLVQPSGQPAR